MRQTQFYLWLEEFQLFHKKVLVSVRLHQKLVVQLLLASVVPPLVLVPLLRASGPLWRPSWEL